MPEETEPADERPVTLRIQQSAPERPVWKLTLRPDALEFAPADGQRPTVIERTEVSERLELHNGLILRRALVVELELGDEDKTVFVLEPAEFDQLDRWLGPPSQGDLRRALKRRLGIAWTVPVGLLFVYTGWAQEAEPVHGLGATGLEAQRIALGVILIVMGVLSRLSPRRWLFLLYAFWFSAFSADRVLDALNGRTPLLQFPLAVAGALLAMGGLRQFYRFAVMAPEPVTGPAS